MFVVVRVDLKICFFLFILVLGVLLLKVNDFCDKYMFCSCFLLFYDEFFIVRLMFEEYDFEVFE